MKDKPITKKELDRAIQEALKNQSYRKQNNTNTNRIINNGRTSYYRVELTNGSIIKAKSAIKDGTHFTIKDIQGLEFSMLKSEIKKVTKIFPEY